MIVVASTDFDHTHSEYVRIVGISADKRTLNIQPSLKYTHYGEDEYYGSVKFSMKAEVGVLSRNI